MHEWLLQYKALRVSSKKYTQRTHPLKERIWHAKNSRHKSNVALEYTFIYVKHDMFIIKLHNSPRWRSSPLEMATVMVNTSKCDHNTKTAMLLQQRFPQRGAAQRGQRQKDRAEVKHSRQPETSGTYLEGKGKQLQAHLWPHLFEFFFFFLSSALKTAINPEGRQIQQKKKKMNITIIPRSQRTIWKNKQGQLYVKWLNVETCTYKSFVAKKKSSLRTSKQKIKHHTSTFVHLKEKPVVC